MIEGFGRANILLPGGTQLYIDSAFYSSKSNRNLLSFKDIRRNGYHIETTNRENQEYLVITDMISGKKCTLKKFPALSSGMYYTFISTIETHAIANQKFASENKSNIWHDQLGHPGTIMMRRIIENSCGHSLRRESIPQYHIFSCAACSKGKLMLDLHR